MGKINYNISEISDVEDRSITRANHINNFIINDNNVIVSGNDLNIYKVIDDIKRINGTILFTVDKYIENDNKTFNLLIKGIMYRCNYTSRYLDTDNIYAALYIGNNEFTLYKLDSDETPMLSIILQLLNRINNVDMRLTDIEQNKLKKDKTWRIF